MGFFPFHILHGAVLLELSSHVQFCSSVSKERLSAADLDRLIGMAWEDRTPFEAIEAQFGLKENEVRMLMRRHLKPDSFRRWRARVKGRSTKHARLRGFFTGRFRSASQRGS